MLSNIKEKEVKFRKTSIKAFAIIIAFLLIVTSNSLTELFSADVKAASQSDLEAKNSTLKDKAKDLQDKIAEHEGDLQDKEAYIDTINAKINVVTERINLLDDEVRELERNVVALGQEIVQKEEDIIIKEKEVEEKFVSVSGRLRQVNKSGNVSSLQMILDCDNYVDFLVQSKLVERIALNDNKAIEELEKEIEAIDAEKAKLDSDKINLGNQKSSVETLRTEANGEKDELDSLHIKAAGAMQEAAKTVESIKEILNKNQAEQEQLDKEIKDLIAAQSQSGGGYGGNYVGSGDFGAGSMLWPVPSIHNITSYFGPRWGRVHKGIDIAGGYCYGEEIVAAADGVVIKAQTADSWGSGYGYHVIIDHGPNAAGTRISTLYAHSSSVFVSEGQSVKAGQAIARIGNTGNSFGAHLHFEVRENGNAVNPISNGYVSG